MWQFLTFLSLFGTVPSFCRKVEQQVFGANGPKPRDWAIRKEDPVASYARPYALEQDIWAKKRKRLDVDIWADTRRGGVDADRVKSCIRGVPLRRKYILETLDGGESLYRRQKGRDVVQPGQ